MSCSVRRVYGQDLDTVAPVDHYCANSGSGGYLYIQPMMCTLLIFLLIIFLHLFRELALYIYRYKNLIKTTLVLANIQQVQM